MSRTGFLRDLAGIRHPYILGATLILTLAQMATGAWLIGFTSATLFLILLLLSCLLLRPVFWPVALGVASLVTGFLYFVNRTKIGLTQLPVTFIDFAILAKDPQGFFNAMQFSRIEAVALLVAAAGVWIVTGFMVVYTCFRPKLDVRGAVAVQVGSMLIFAALLAAFAASYVRSVHGYLERNKFAWSPPGVAKLSRQLGVYGFLLYSYVLDRSHTGAYFTRPSDGPPPAPAEIDDAARLFVHLHAVSPGDLPNIMVVLAESTFDFNIAFKLKQPVRNEMFEWHDQTRALGPVYPNAVGGGTWLSEFETLVGMDERLFGYAGYYTHSSLAPFVKRSFVTYLESKGYSTIALYPTEGTFYNARNAFKSYGFQRFLDVQELGIKSHWHATDEEIAQAVISKGGLKALPSPFFAYVDFLENHAPHKCDHFTDAAQFFTTFSDPAGFEQNCILNEFIRRAKSSEAGFRELLAFMQEIRDRTGRPYVLMIFGDHQPHTFTSNDIAWTKFDYTTFRTAASPRQTFFQILSSLPDVMNCCQSGIPHLSLLPTLLSAYTAATPEDLYLGVNFLAYERCGSDLVPGSSHGFYDSNSGGSAATHPCDVFDKVLSSYRQTHTF